MYASLSLNELRKPYSREVRSLRTNWFLCYWWVSLLTLTMLNVVAQILIQHQSIRARISKCTQRQRLFIGNSIPIGWWFTCKIIMLTAARGGPWEQQHHGEILWGSSAHPWPSAFGNRSHVWAGDFLWTSPHGNSNAKLCCFISLWAY